jgi:cytochrome c553
MARELSDGDLQSLAGSIAALPPPEPPADPGDAARLGQARMLIEQNHCNICHLADFSGQENVPRLADQREDYLLKTLRDYKSGARHGYDATMAEVLQPISDAQLVDLAYYLSHLR